MTDVLKEGDMVKVKVLAIDDRGKIKLSMRAVDQATGEPLDVAAPAAAPAARGRGSIGAAWWRRRDGGFRRRRERRVAVTGSTSRAADRWLTAGGERP